MRPFMSLRPAPTRSVQVWPYKDAAPAQSWAKSFRLKPNRTARSDYNSRSFSTANVSAKPLKPEEGVRQAVIKQLRNLGWTDARLQWKPEWAVPDTPHDLTKRERGHKFK